MSTVKAELLAVEALRAYLGRTLPAKVDVLNAARAAVLVAPRAGPYTLAGSLYLGILPTGQTTVAVSGTLTAAQVATLINAAAPSGLTASADSRGRLVLTASAAPSGSTPSAVFVGASAENRALGWPAGGTSLVLGALVAPDSGGISDGQDVPVSFTEGNFAVVLGARSTRPRSPNIRDDVHVVTMQVEVYAAEPQGSVEASHEFLAQAVRAVREVVLEDRTLDGAVHLALLDAVTVTGRTFRFETPGGASPLMTSAVLTLAVHVFERS